MVEVLDFFFKVITVQLIYGFLITVVLYSTVGQINTADISDFQTQKNLVDVNKTVNIVENQLTNQTGFGIVDIVALVIFTGNALLDLVLNTIFAIPSMISLILNVLFNYLHVGGAIKTVALYTLTTLGFLAYALIMIGTLVGIRSQGSVR
jgi:hypothetical protein